MRHYIHAHPATVDAAKYAKWYTTTHNKPR